MKKQIDEDLAVLNQELKRVKPDSLKGQEILARIANLKAQRKKNLAQAKLAEKKTKD
jgi:hypothetical protein